MSNVHALLIAVETYQDASLPPIVHAEAGMRSLASTLRTQGIAEANLTLLTNTTATRTVIESKLRQFAKKRAADDALIVVIIGHIIASAGQNYLLAADAIADDALATALPFSDLLDHLNRAAVPFTLFLDSGAMVNVPPEFDAEAIQAYLEPAELAELAETSAFGVIFSATGGDESSAIDGTRRVWLDLLERAFNGSAGLETITVGALHDYLEREMPRAIRKSLATPIPQRPQAWGIVDRGFPILTVRPIGGTSATLSGVDLEQLKRIAFRAETSQRFKSLTGFQKGHRVPDQVTAYTEKFLAKLAIDDIRNDIEEIYNALRENLHFKRKDLEAATETDGSGFIRTPQFDYTLHVRLDRDDPSMVIWRREISNLHDPQVVQSAPFQAVFGNTFDRLVFEFMTPLDVARLVDHIEDSEAPGVKVRLSSDESSCAIQLDGFAGTIRIDRETLQIEGRQTQTSASLIQQFFEFQRRFATHLDLKQLPLTTRESE